jgi:hypothetical protein
MELAYRRENIIFKVFIYPTQRQHLQDITKPSKLKKKNEKIRLRKEYIFFCM